MFCHNCGDILLEGARLCSSCGAEAMQTGSFAAHGSSLEMHTITISRAEQAFLFNSAIELVVDGKEKVFIAEDAVIEISVMEGRHHLAFRCGFRKKAIDINVYGDLIFELRWNRAAGQLEDNLV